MCRTFPDAVIYATQKVSVLLGKKEREADRDTDGRPSSSTLQPDRWSVNNSQRDTDAMIKCRSANTQLAAMIDVLRRTP